MSRPSGYPQQYGSATAGAARAGSPQLGSRVGASSAAASPSHATLNRAPTQGMSGSAPAASASPAAGAGAAPAGGFGSRMAEMRARRPSKVVVDQERKTEYWRSLVSGLEQAGGFKLGSNDVGDVIARALSYGLIKDKRTRDANNLNTPPDPRLVLAGLEKLMIARLIELNNGQPVRLDPRTPPLEKIVRMEKAIQVLEERKAKLEAEESAKVQDKIGELQTSLKQLETRKEQQRETQRRTMKLELNNLRDAMSQMQAQETQSTGRTSNEPAAVQEMQTKMARLEAALRVLNENRKQQPDDKETLLLKRKLALFEQKFQDLEAQKTVSAAAESADGLRDKLLLMEDKLAKMERRKSVSISMMMKDKMENVEKQLEMLRNQRSGGGNPGVEGKMRELEDQLRKLQNTQVTPAMVNDEETVKKLENAMLAAEKNMEQQRLKVEQERLRMIEERRREDERFREESKRREQELLLMEQRVAQSGASNPGLANRMERLEQNMASAARPSAVDPAIAQKMKEMEDRLAATQRALAEERETTRAFLAVAPTEGPALEQWQSQMQIQWLQETNRQLMEKLEASSKLMDEKIKQMQNIQFTGGAAIQRSGLTYAEINAKLAEIQKELFDPNTNDQRQEQLNIEYEKLITELEQTSEYQAEQAAAREKWRAENEPLNNEALLQTRQSLRLLGDQGCLELFKTKPELRMVLNTPDQIIRRHANDFSSLTTQNLNLTEARALYAAMPKFRKEQEKQIAWVDSLKQKIETEASKPSRPAPPPIAATKKVVFKKPPGGAKGGGGGGGGDFLAELLKKRSRKE